VAEQFALVVAENLFLGQIVLAGAGGNGAHSHHHDVVPAQIGFLQHLPQVLHVVVVAHRHQHAAGARMNRRRVDLLLMIEIEFFERLGLQVLATPAPLVDAARDSEQHEQH
jgi:hypothetical protein